MKENYTKSITFSGSAQNSLFFPLDVEELSYAKFKSEEDDENPVDGVQQM